ncbi:MAG: pyridoxal-dependent decarboxylase [Actinomycetota bacterium]
MASDHMSAEEFRRHGHTLIDWVADYMEKVESYPVQSRVRPGEIRAKLPVEAPEQPEPFDAILRDLDEIILPGITHWQSPGWFAYFPGNASPPAILGELASAGLNVQGMLWSTSPACTELESVVMDWLVGLLDLPSAWRTTGPGGGVIQMSASDSTHTALVVARHRAAQRAPVASLVAYASAQAHSSVEKGARVAGYEHFRPVDVDDAYVMSPDALRAAVAEDLAAGLTPAAVVSTVGTTGTGAVDPVRAVGEIAREHRMWHHVDAAYAGTAMICPEFRHFQDGLELVDSYTFNPHKWMLTNLDCSAFFVADRSPLIEALGIFPPYLRNRASESGEVIDYRDWHVALGRRFRALKLWFVLRSYGAEGIRRHVRHSVQMARGLAERLEKDDRFEVVAPIPFALVCFQHIDGNSSTDTLAAAVNAADDVYVTPSRIDDLAFIRVSVGQTRTDQRHVDRLWEIIDQNAPAVHRR